MVARLKGKKTKNSLKKDKKKNPSSQVEARAKPEGLAKTTAKSRAKGKPKAKTGTKLRAQTKASTKTKRQAKPRPAAKTKHRTQTQVKSDPETSTPAHPDVPDNIDDILAEFRGHIGTSKEDRVGQKEREIDEYLEQTAIANPHARITYITPTNETIEFPRTVDELPEEPREIKPHPKGIELGTLIQMLERTDSKKLGKFLQGDFCRVGATKATEIAKKAGLTGNTWVTGSTKQRATL